MDFPIYLQLFGWKLHPHVVGEALAYLIGFRLYLWLRVREKRRAGSLDDAHDRNPLAVLAGAMAGAVVGA